MGQDAGLNFSGIPKAAGGRGADAAGLNFSGIPPAASATTAPTTPSTDDTTGDVVLDNIRAGLRMARGAARGAVSTVQALASPIRRAFGMAPATPPAEETTTAGKIGRGVEQAAEFFVPESLAGEATKLLTAGPALTTAAKAALTAGGADILARAQGDQNPEVAAAVSGGSALLPAAAGAVERTFKSAAARKLAAFFGSAPTEPKIVRDQIAKIVPTALDEGIPATWTRWLAQTEGKATRTGQALEATVAGPAGDAMVPVQPVLNALDDLAEKARIMLPDASGALTVEGPVKDPALLNQIRFFKSRLQGMGVDEVPARVLHDVKSTWNAFAKFDSSTPITTLAEQVRAAQARAARTAVGAIRDVLATGAPDISKLDTAYATSMAIHQAVVDAALEAQGKALVAGKIVAKPLAQQAKYFASTGLGAGAGAYAGYRREGVGGALAGALAGSVTGRMLDLAFQSPLWKTKGIQFYNAVAEAIAKGDANTVRRLVTPLIAQQGATVGAGR